jgi:hypothetical protein
VISCIQEEEEEEEEEEVIPRNRSSFVRFN